MNLQLFEGIPEKSTTHCSSYPSAVLALPDNDTNTIEIGKSSQVISNRNALVVGRQASSCDIRITHKSLSRQHALLYYYTNCNSSTSTSSASASASNSTTNTETTTIRQQQQQQQQRPDLYVFDLETKAGTFINQKKIKSKTPVRLRNGDTIQFGKANPILTVRWEEKDSKNDDDDDDDNNNNNNNSKISDGDMRKPTQTTKTTTTTENSEAPEGEIDRHNESDSNKNANLEKETEEEEEDQYAGLTGRARRQAEIAAMMSSLEQKPTYTKFVPSFTEENQTNLSSTGEKISSSTTISASQNNQQCSPHRKKVLEKYRLPLTDCTDMAVLESSAMSCAVMDPTGSRFAIASMDSSLKLYDFAGYNLLDPVPFFNGIVEDGYPILSMAYSSDGSSILIGTGSSQCRVFDRDGQELVKFVRGDVYVRDPSKTIGHTAAVTSVGWHPLHKSIVFTTSRDGSMRSWNIDKGKFSFGMLNCSDVVVIKHLRTGRKTIPTCLAVSTNTLAIGTECGSLQIYKYPLVSKLRPQQSVQASPALLGSKDGYSIVSLVYSVDETKLAVRTKTEVTVWNTASRLSTSTPPWMKFVNLPLHDDDVNSSTPTMAFSPNGKVLCIATSTRDENNSRIVRSSLEIFIISKEAQKLENNKSLTPICSLPVLDTDTGHSILSLSWHQKLNQILVTTPKGFQIWYSTDWSKKGILLTSSRRRKRKNIEDELQDIYKSRAPPPGTAIRHEEIITPNSLPLFSTDKPRSSKKQRSEEEHRESVAQRIPQKPSKDIYNTSDIMFKQMISDGNSSKQKIIAGKDPREALAEYNEGKSFIGQAYEGNIERILTTKTIEQEMDEMNNKKK